MEPISGIESIADERMGISDSEKLDPALGKDRYNFDKHRKYFGGLLDALDLGNDVILVIHDVGSMFGFDWAKQNRDRIQGIAYMESIVMPLIIKAYPEPVRETLSSRP